MIRRAHAIPRAPLFSSFKRYKEMGFVSYYCDAGECLTLGQEWEYPPSMERRLPALSWHTAWRNLYIDFGHPDGDGVYEIVLPPVGMPADGLNVAKLALQTALLFFLEVPIAQNGVCGRHVHIAPVPDSPVNVAEALQCTAPLFASRIEVRGGKINPVFRRAADRFAYYVDSVSDNHYAAASFNPADNSKPATLELRRAETIPLIAGVGAYVGYRIISGKRISACQHADRAKFFDLLASEVCSDEYCRGVLETYRQVVEETARTSENGSYQQSWRSVKPLYRFFDHFVGHISDVVDRMRGDLVTRRGSSDASCYRCDNLPFYILENLPMTYEEMVVRYV